MERERKMEEYGENADSDFSESLEFWEEWIHLAPINQFIYTTIN